MSSIPNRQIEMSRHMSDELHVRRMMKTPRHKREGFLFTDEVTKAGADIEFTIRTPQEIISDEPVLIVGGFGGIKPVYGDFRDALAYSLRQPVASFRRPRTENSIRAGLTIDKILHPAKIGPQSVVAMVDMLHERYKKPVTVIGHSMGGPNSVDGALRRKDKVGQVIMLGSGGLEENSNATKFINRGPAIFKDEILPAVGELAGRDSLKIAYESLYYMLRQPWRTIGEALDVGRRPLMERELGELAQAGITTHAVQLAEDRFFPLEDATRDAADLVHGFHVIREANHMLPITKAERTAAFIGGIILEPPEQIVA